MKPPELILTDCTVLTMDEERPEAGAVAFRDGRVLAVGEPSKVGSLAGPRTRTWELDGACVVPGFIDAHTHAARLGEMHFRADLDGAAHRQAVVEVLSQRAERTPSGGWVIGWNWDESHWPDQEPLSPADLEEVSTEHPVMARRVCGHKAVVNARALEELDMEGSGVLTEDAADLAWELCAPAYETCRKGLEIESRRLASLGITHVADTAGARDVRLLTQGARERFLLQRSAMYVREGLIEHLEALTLGPVRGPHCSVLGVKTYTDGSVGARTAALSEPYADADTTGMLLRDAKQVEALANRCRHLGLQLKAHAIGDAAIQAVLDGMQAASLDAEERPRIEHAELVNQEQLEVMGERGVIACMQPNFVGNWQGEDGLYHEALGNQRRLAMNPFKSALEAGVPLAFSSDGMPYDPLYGIQCALDHPNPQERLTVEEALFAYTRGAAFALGFEEERGTLREGALGDAVVLSEDPRRAGRVEDLVVQATILDGQVVHPAR